MRFINSRVITRNPATSFRVDRSNQMQEAEEQGKQQLITMSFQSQPPDGTEPWKTVSIASRRGSSLKAIQGLVIDFLSEWMSSLPRSAPGIEWNALRGAIPRIEILPSRPCKTERQGCIRSFQTISRISSLFGRSAAGRVIAHLQTWTLGHAIIGLRGQKPKS